MIYERCLEEGVDITKDRIEEKVKEKPASDKKDKKAKDKKKKKAAKEED